MIEVIRSVLLGDSQQLLRGKHGALTLPFGGLGGPAGGGGGLPTT